MRESYHLLEDVVKSLLRNDKKNSDTYLEILNFIANLMNENNSGRFHGASCDRSFTVDRLSIVVKFGER